MDVSSLRDSIPFLLPTGDFRPRLRIVASLRDCAMEDRCYPDLVRVVCAHRSGACPTTDCSVAARLALLAPITAIYPPGAYGTPCFSSSAMHSKIA